MSDADAKREALKEKVAQSRASLDHTALPESDPPEGLKALAMDYPFALVAGGVVLGALAGALLPRSAARRLAQAAIGAATVAGELGMTYGRQALDAATEAGSEGRQKIGELTDRLGEFGGTLGDGAADAGRRAASATTDAGRRAAAVAGDAAETARDAGLKIAQQVIRLTSQLRH